MRKSVEYGVLLFVAFCVGMIAATLNAVLCVLALPLAVIAGYRLRGRHHA